MICKEILSIIEFEQYTRPYIYFEVRKSLYNDKVSKSQSRQRIKQSIKILKQRNLIVEMGGYIGLKK
jgi:hypothetical protein